MHYPERYPPLKLGELEQVVFAIEGRIVPSLNDLIWILAIAPAWIITSALILHRLFRPICYLITTQRVIAIEPNGGREDIYLSEITRTRGTKTSLMLIGAQKRLWLSRLPDAWFFEHLIGKTIEKVSSNRSAQRAV